MEREGRKLVWWHFTNIVLLLHLQISNLLGTIGKAESCLLFSWDLNCYISFAWNFRLWRSRHAWHGSN
jgi:hypothetical protein